MFLLEILYNLKILPTISQCNQGYIMYSFLKNIHFGDYNYFLEYLYDDKNILTIQQILKLIEDKNIIQKNNKVLLDIKDKYKNNTNFYKLFELFNNNDIISLYKEVPFIYSYQYYKLKNTGEGKDFKQIYSYEGLSFFKNILDENYNSINHKNLTLKHNLNFNYNDVNSFVHPNKYFEFNDLKYNNVNRNNTIFIYLNSDIKQNILSISNANSNNDVIFKNKINLEKFIINYSIKQFKLENKEVMEKIFLLNRKKFNYDYISGTLNDYNDQYLKHLKKNNNIDNYIINILFNNDIFEIENIKCKNILFDVYTISFNNNINLQHIFKEMETSYYIPIIKYVSNEETQYYNIYKPFFRNINSKTMNMFLLKKDRISKLKEEISSLEESNFNLYKLKYLYKKDYLQIKIRIDDNNLMNIYIFENGYILNEFQTLTYINQDDILKYSVFINKIIKKLKNKYKLTYLSLVNPENLFKNTDANISYAKLINTEFLYELRIDYEYLHNLLLFYKNIPELEESLNKISIYKNNKLNLLNLYLELFRRINRLNSVIVIPPEPNIDNLELKLIYNVTYGFYSKENIKAYMCGYLKEEIIELIKKKKKYYLIW